MGHSLEALFASQDGLVTRRQALEFVSDNVLLSRLGRRWQVVLPGVYAERLGLLSVKQRYRAALLYAGRGAMLSDTSALRMYGVPFVPNESEVRVLIPAAVQRLSRQFVVTKRSFRMPESVVIDGLAVAPLCRALCELGARHDVERDSIAVVAAAVQNGMIAPAQLAEEAQAGQARGRPRLMRVLAPIEAGVRSAPEGDFRLIVARSRVLPTPMWNGIVQLADGRRFSPDALFEDAAVIHEVNGRIYHAPDEAGEDAFEAMQRRNDALVAAGFEVLHNSPRRLLTEPDAVRQEVEAVYRRNAGRGLPEGVTLLRSGPAA